VQRVDPNEGETTVRKRSMVVYGILFPLNLYVRLYWIRRLWGKIFFGDILRGQSKSEPDKNSSSRGTMLDSEHG
jgi:hypothetical protein